MICSVLDDITYIYNCTNSVSHSYAKKRIFQQIISFVDLIKWVWHNISKDVE